MTPPISCRVCDKPMDKQTARLYQSVCSNECRERDSAHTRFVEARHDRRPKSLTQKDGQLRAVLCC